MLNEVKEVVEYLKSVGATECDITTQDGMHISCKFGPVVLTPESLEDGPTGLENFQDTSPQDAIYEEKLKKVFGEEYPGLQAELKRRME